MVGSTHLELTMIRARAAALAAYLGLKHSAFEARHLLFPFEIRIRNMPR